MGKTFRRNDSNTDKYFRDKFKNYPENGKIIDPFKWDERASTISRFDKNRNNDKLKKEK